MKEWLESILFNVSQKSRNPFFGTLFAVFLFRHWQFFYALLNFDASTTLKEKQFFIYNHFSDKAWFWEISVTVLLALVTLIVSYFFLNLSRLIVNWFEKVVTPWVYELTDKSSVVLKVEFEKLKNENDRLQNRYEKERDEKVRLRTEIENLIQTNIADTRPIDPSYEKDFEKQKPLEKTNNAKATDNDLISNFPRDTNTAKNVDNRIIQIVNLFNNFLEKDSDDDRFYDYLNFVGKINSSYFTGKEEDVKYFSKLGLTKRGKLISGTRKEDGKRYYYVFTDLGKEFLKYIVDNDLGFYNKK